MDLEQLHKVYKQTQVGRIVEFIDPVTEFYSVADVEKIFKANSSYTAIPVEGGNTTAIIEKQSLEHAPKSFFSEPSLEKLINKRALSFNSRESVYSVLNKVLEQREGSSISQSAFVVYDKGRYLGMVNFIDLVTYVNELNQIDQENAHELQQFLLEKNAAQGLPIQVHSYNAMASSLGGDYLLTQNLGNDRSVIACFDVSGKGVTGALSTISISSFFSLAGPLAMEQWSPEAVVEALNRFLCEQTPFGTFVTGALVFVDRHKDKVQIFNCGHTPTMILQRGKGLIQSLNPNLSPLGIHEELNDLESKVQEIPANADLQIVLYSDGLSEATNSHGKMFGEQAVTEYFTHGMELSIGEIIAGLRKKLEDFRADAPLTDDVTIMGIDFSGYSSAEIINTLPKLSKLIFPLAQNFDFTAGTLGIQNNRGSAETKRLRSSTLLFSSKGPRSILVGLTKAKAVEYAWLFSEGNRTLCKHSGKGAGVSQDLWIGDSGLPSLILALPQLMENAQIVSAQEIPEKGPGYTKVSISLADNPSEVRQIDVVVNVERSLVAELRWEQKGQVIEVKAHKWVRSGNAYFPKELIIQLKGSETLTKLYVSNLKTKHLPDYVFNREYLDTKSDSWYEEI